jgi:hypothetical protein
MSLRRKKRLQAALTEPASNIILGLFFGRICENFGSRSKLDQPAEIKKGSVVRDATGLLHVVGHCHDGVLCFEFVDQFLDLCRRNGIKRRARLIPSGITSGSTARARAMQSRLLLAAGKAKRICIQSVLHFIPERRTAQTFLDRFIDARSLCNASDAQAIRNVFVNRFRKWI